MNRIIILAAFIALLMGACSFPRYLPQSDRIDVNEYGSYIRINKYSGGYLRGELIAIDSANIFVLTEETRQCVSIPRNDAKAFNLRYAASKNYGWSIPVFSLVTISHGLFLIITFPVNLIVTSVVTASGLSAFTYTNKNLPVESLSMFAGFPDGIPPNIDVADIK